METPYSETVGVVDIKPQMNYPGMEELRKMYHKLYSSPKILVVDDEENDFLSLKDMFEQLGVQLFHSKSIKTSIAMLKEANFSLILLDWKLPNGLGAELLDFLNSTNSPIPVAIYTGYMDSVVLSEASKKRTVALISKPITPAQTKQLLAMFKLA